MTVAQDRWIGLARGPLALATLAVLFEVLSQGGFAIPRVDAFLMLVVAYVAFVDGVAAGVLSAGIASLYYGYASSPQGRIFHLQVFEWEHIVIVSVAMPVLALIVGVLRNQLQEANVREQATRRELDMVLERMQAGFYTVDPEGRIRYINARATSLAGMPRDRLIGRPASQPETRLPGAVDEDALLDALRSQTATSFDWHDPKRDAWFDVQMHPFPDGVAVHFLDVTERKRIQERTQGIAKWESLGRLAGGVAHDFNNLLTAIHGYNNLVMDDMQADDPRREHLQQVSAAADRAGRLTRQLLAYAKRQVLLPQPLDLNEQIENMMDMLRRLVRSDVQIVTEFDDGLFPAQVDASQFEQIVLNLVINASDAMPSGGRITIQTSQISLDQPRPHALFVIEPGDYALVTFEDTGIGMDDATMERIFEPFFTTKGELHGTGLGLSTVFGIVKQSGGYIFVDSYPGAGSAFKVWLPRAEGKIDMGDSDAKAEEGAAAAATILVVEDNEAVRTISVRVLRSQGYHVLEARDGAEALAVAEGFPKEIDLLFTDVIMPGLSGRELARRLSVARPGIKVLYTSGYTSDAQIQGGIARGVLDPDLAFLQKPFTPADLTKRMREILGEQAT